jgi:hypothetical protein
MHRMYARFMRVHLYLYCSGHYTAREQPNPPAATAMGSAPPSIEEEAGGLSAEMQTPGVHAEEQAAERNGTGTAIMRSAWE